MSDLYALSDEELLTTDVTTLVEDTNTDTDVTYEPVSSVQEDVEETGTDVPNEQEEPIQSNTEQSDDTSVVDYQAFYENMTKPFKANGRDIQISNADDAIRLMQMGANYSKKMEALKPKQALIKTLEDNGLTSKEQLGYLIDLANKKPEAIAKLIQDSQIDLYEFDTSQAESYQPSVEIKETSQFEDTLSEVIEFNPNMYQVVQDMSAWDIESKDVIYNNPNLLRILSEQQSNGTYTKIVNKIANERLFGRMNDVNFLQAYALVEKELLDTQKSFTAPRPQTKPDETSLDKKRKASLPTGNNNPVSETVNYLSMSDEDFLKLQLS